MAFGRALECLRGSVTRSPDTTFTAGLPDQRAHTAIVHGIASMAYELDIPCIVEGVETEAQRTALQGMSVQAQGWLWGQPKGPEQIPTLTVLPLPRAKPDQTAYPLDQPL